MSARRINKAALFECERPSMDEVRECKDGPKSFDALLKQPYRGL